MRRNYIVLRRSPERTEDLSVENRFSLGPRGSLGHPAIMEFETLTDGEAVDLAHADTVRAVIREVPLKLIRPLASPEQPGPLSRGAAWGIEAVGALDTGLSGKGIKVAVLDTGIDATHDAFRGMNLTEVDYTGEGTGDQDGHGTHCAGTFFGRDVAGIRIGVAQGVTEAFIGKVLGASGGGTMKLLKAIYDAIDFGCRIISMSLGFDFPGAVKRLVDEDGLPIDLATAQALYDYRANVRLFDRVGAFVHSLGLAQPRDFVLLSASGNESKRDSHPRYEMPAAPPGEAEGFISVGALGRTDGGQVAVPPFSNTGCDVCAPGVAILSAKAGSGRDLVALSGTSMATPHAAGVAALLAERQASQPRPAGFVRARASLRDQLAAGSSKQRLARGFNPAHVGHGMVLVPAALSAGAEE